MIKFAYTSIVFYIPDTTCLGLPCRTADQARPPLPPPPLALSLLRAVFEIRTAPVTGSFSASLTESWWFRTPRVVMQIRSERTTSCFPSIWLGTLQLDGPLSMFYVTSQNTHCVCDLCRTRLFGT